MTLFKLVVILCLANRETSTFPTYLQPFQELCPRSITDCGVDDAADNVTIKTNYEDCCGRCSCAADCGQSQSCCFVEDNVLYTQTHGKECINPTDGNEADFVMSGGHGVMMITRCLDKDENCKYRHGLQYVSPVESDEGDVFINQNCAFCNNVSSFIRWNVEIIVIKDNIKTETLRTLADIDTNSTNIDTKIFLPTHSTPTKCQATFRHIDESRCPNKIDEEKCSSVFLPYVNGIHTYRNVFCFLCEKQFSKGCIRKNNIKDRPKLGSFIMILNTGLNVNDISAYYSRRNFDSENCPENFIPHPYKV